MLNKVIMIGNLTKDPELRYTAKGEAVVNLRLACNRKYKSGNEMKEEVCFVNIVVWAKRAENCNQYLKKGSPILVDGRLQSRTWEKDGVKQYATEIVAENIQFLNRTKEGTSPDQDKEQTTEQEWLEDGGQD